MSTYDVKLPDVGEGVAEAELITWLVEVGDRVTSDSVLAEVMTDKATVEVACPVSGVVVELHGEPGDVLAVGGGLVSIELDGAAPAPRAPATPNAQVAAAAPVQAASAGTPRVRTLAAPAVRSRAASLGIDLATVAGSGPDGRVLHTDLDRVLLGRSGSTTTAVVASGADEPHVEPVRGLRRRIAERLTSAWTQIPHITYVDAIDVTDLEILRAELNRRNEPTATRLTILPFLARAIVLAAAEQPRLNATYDAVAQTLSIFDAVHLGIATQTDDGLIVPVVRHAEARGLWDLAAEIGRVASAARAGSATRQELSGSTITITSLGALGGLVTTPIINQPEVAIIGVNKLETRPVWRNGAFEPRQMMNLSSSFDHRIVDGWDAATFVQRIKALLELPALLFVDGDPSAPPVPLGR
ncbi:MAG: dihydrolipoamide acetyltransferase family protein [Actinobacteria bacterium]|nr:dihydrolipoamide acetyltransferase family protein [Actinomycetota bacterium]